MVVTVVVGEGGVVMIVAKKGRSSSVCSARSLRRNFAFCRRSLTFKSAGIYAILELSVALVEVCVFVADGNHRRAMLLSARGLVEGYWERRGRTNNGVASIFYLRRTRKQRFPLHSAFAVTEGSRRVCECVCSMVDPGANIS